MADFFGFTGFFFFAVALSSLFMALWCTSKRNWDTEWEDRGSKFIGGFIGFLLLGFVFLVTAGIISDNTYREWANEKCAGAGGYIIEQYRSDDLCVSEDGRIIPNWKSS